MKTWKLVTAITLAVAIVALLTITVNAQMMGGGSGYNSYGTYSPYGGFGGYGGMMGGGNSYGYGYPQYPAQPGLTTPTTPYQTIYPSQFGGGGCHGRGGWNGYLGQPYPYNGAILGPITNTTAVTIAQNYLASLGNPDLAILDAEEYSRNFYISFYEKSTGIGAFEVLVDKYTGSIYPEMGPNMMWNTKYGMMRGGILGGIWGTPTTTMPITAEQAETSAQQFLTATLPGATVGEVTPFYGYYHVMVVLSGNTYGMLSVNSYTGQVWYHNWHGAFIQELEVS